MNGIVGGLTTCCQSLTTIDQTGDPVTDPRFMLLHKLLLGYIRTYSWFTRKTLEYLIPAIVKPVSCKVRSLCLL